jgi:hypothetical protein
VCLDPPGLWSVPKYMYVCMSWGFMNEQAASKQASNGECWLESCGIDETKESCVIIGNSGFRWPWRRRLPVPLCFSPIPSGMSGCANMLMR